MVNPVSDGKYEAEPGGSDRNVDSMCMGSFEAGIDSMLPEAQVVGVELSAERGEISWAGSHRCIHPSILAHLQPACYARKLKSRNCPKCSLLSVFPLCWRQTWFDSGFVAHDKSEFNKCIHSSRSARTQLACRTQKLKSGTKQPKIQPSQCSSLTLEANRAGFWLCGPS
jgi:hypothetical protein